MGSAMSRNWLCTYPLAPNYNATATMDDGSCELICQADLNGDGDVQIKPSGLLDGVREQLRA